MKGENNNKKDLKPNMHLFIFNTLGFFSFFIFSLQYPEIYSERAPAIKSTFIFPGH